MCAETETPFCDVNNFGKAKCVKTQNKICAETEGSNFDCLSAGIFPDPINCKKYYNCFDDGQDGFKADVYECENFYVFDPNFIDNSYCRLTYNFFCVQADCSGSSKNILLNYSRYTKGQYVATCRANGKPPLVTKCDEGYVADLKMIPVECKINCNGPAKYADPKESTKYLECIFDGITWKETLKSCFRDHYFDKISKQCVLNPTTKKRE